MPWVSSKSGRSQGGISVDDINERLEDLVDKMKKIGDRPAPHCGGSLNNILDYNSIRERILELCLEALRAGYRFKKEG